MALIAQLTEISKARQTVHRPVDCGYSVFTGPDGQRYVQLETFGSKERKIVNVTSQAIQINESSAAELKRLIEETFPSLR